MRIYKCKECGWICNANKKGAIGTAHAHAEKHTGTQILGLKIPASLTLTANPEKLGRKIEEIKIKDAAQLRNHSTTPNHVKED